MRPGDLLVRAVPALAVEPSRKAHASPGTAPGGGASDYVATDPESSAGPPKRSVLNTETRVPR